MKEEVSRILLDIIPRMNMILKADMSDFIIGGYASVELRDEAGNILPDVQGDNVDLGALEEAFNRMMKVPSRRNLMAYHSNAQIGELLFSTPGSDGRVWESKVIKDPSPPQYPDRGLFVISRLFGDTEISRRYIDAMKRDHMLSFSIGGEALNKKRICIGGTCLNNITSLDLYEISSCERGANPKAKGFMIKADLNEQPLTHDLISSVSDGASLLRALAEGKYRRMPK